MWALYPNHPAPTLVDFKTSASDCVRLCDDLVPNFRETDDCVVFLCFLQETNFCFYLHTIVWEWKRQKGNGDSLNFLTSSVTHLHSSLPRTLSHVMSALMCTHMCCRWVSVCMCLRVHACTRTPEIQVRRGPCGSRAPGSEVRLMTSTEHPGGRV